MKFSSPLPQTLPKECAKAAKILRSFVDASNNGLDGVIPRHVLENAKGFAIFTIIKAGLLFSARAGSGIVIARLEDGTWSAPGAIGTAGLGVGGQMGAEVTDFIIVLNSSAAVATFMSAGSLTLGGNMSVAVGPLGRNGEASGSLSTKGKVAAMYSYSKTRGLFGGVSLEGSVIVERQDANVQAYEGNVTAKKLLSGAVPPPSWALPLIKTIESCTGLPGNHKWVNDDLPRSPGYAFGGMASPSSETPPAQLKKRRKPSFPPADWGHSTDTGSYFTPTPTDIRSSLSTEPQSWKQSHNFATSSFDTQFASDFTPNIAATRHNRFSQSVSQPVNLFDPSPPYHTRSMSYTPSPTQYSSGISSKTNPFQNDLDFAGISLTDSRTTSMSQPGQTRALALFDFSAVEAGDLSFSKGDTIIIVKKSNTVDDWWTGRCHDREGIFPANFVELL